MASGCPPTNSRLPRHARGGRLTIRKAGKATHLRITMDHLGCAYFKGARPLEHRA
ncbi:DUF6420 family protein [Streptomyces microflavus]|uniref:DUF6420 family protein n=1 Tax=Streptomyces microflavus TaxID=1919 RepID=UPI001E44E127|nr:DUF6420 family protein [Streptomyces microflavus]